MDKLIPPRLCAWCAEPYTPTKGKQQLYCGLTCAGRATRRRLQGVPPEAAIAAKRVKDAARGARVCGERFGVLSEREQAIFMFAEKVGYDRGYMAAYAPLRRKSA